MTPRLGSAVSVVAALAALLAVAGCGEEPGTEAEPAREGLALELDGITYDIFLTRELNVEDVEDQGYVEGIPEAPSGAAYYGVFLQACNVSEEALTAAGSFRMVDSQGNEFEPLELERGNPFAYVPTTLQPGDCFPASGSLASSAPTGGALLVFELPLETIENLPIELVIQDGYDIAEARPKELVVELDI
jgi:hypothetical protein